MCLLKINRKFLYELHSQWMLGHEPGRMVQPRMIIEIQISSHVLRATSWKTLSNMSILHSQLYEIEIHEPSPK